MTAYPRRKRRTKTTEREITMNRELIIGLVAGVVLLLSPLAVLADGHEEERGAISDVWLVVPKKGMGGEFGSAVAEHMKFRKAQGEPRAWYAYGVAAGNRPEVIMFRSEPMSWADQDAYEAEDFSAIDDDWAENVEQYVDHYHHYFESYDWENSHWPEGETTSGPFFTVAERTWKTGAGAGPSEAHKKISQHAINDGWADKGYNWLWVNRIGGEPKQSIVFSDANYADMAPDGNSFVKWLGEVIGSEEEAGALISEWLSGFSRTEVTIWRHLELLSTPSGDE
jgi:hypothetical protein